MNNILFSCGFLNTYKIIKFFLISILSCTFLFIIIYFTLFIYIGNNVYKDDKKQSDAILVLGAKSYKGNFYNPCLVERVKHAVELYKQNYSNKLIFSGGNDREDGENEAETMKKIAVSMGVLSDDIILEKQSTSTYENLKFSQDIIKLKNYKTIILVTEPYHSPRAALVAKHLGINTSLSPAVNSQCWQKWKYLSRFFIKEPLAVMGYKIEGKI
jgi:uncharacterized SAM-binding protein YcdF (DUF218 family)